MEYLPKDKLYLNILNNTSISKFDSSAVDKDPLHETETLEEEVNNEEFQRIISKFHVPSKQTTQVEQTFNQNKVQSIEPIETTTKIKKKNRISIFDLKLYAPKPDTVENCDISSANPKLLSVIKSLKNTIKVPANWKLRSSYNKSGGSQFYNLNDKMKSTGINKVRTYDSVNKRKSKHDKTNPKIKKTGLKYEDLYNTILNSKDSFFDQYLKLGEYFNRSTNKKIEKYKPGVLSQRLRVALGMNDQDLPPFVLNMQRYGFPLAYPLFNPNIYNNTNTTNSATNIQSSFVHWGSFTENEGGNIENDNSDYSLLD